MDTLAADFVAKVSGIVTALAALIGSTRYAMD